MASLYVKLNLTSIPFAPLPNPSVKATTLSYAEIGLMNGAPDPMMHFPAGTIFTPYSVLRNLGTQPISITPAIYWMQGGTSHSAPQVSFSIAPLQTIRLDVPSLFAASGLNNFNGILNLVFEFQGAQDSILLASGSVDQTNNYVFEVLPKAIKESGSKNLSFWSTANGDDTMVTVWNPADETQDFIFTIFFSGGHYLLPVHLDPRANRMFNLSEVIDAQAPDSEGNIIPIGVQEGSAQISGTQGENELVLVGMDAGTYNVQKATCHYDCDTCNGAVSSALVTVPFGLAVGGSTQLTFQTTWNTGVKVNLSSSATWGTSASSVATVSAGLVKGVAAGSVTINGVYEIEPLSGQSCGSPPRACPIDYGVSASGGGAVQPTLIVQGNEYSSIFVGSDPNLAGPNSIFASGTPSGGTFTETSSVSSDTFTPVKSGGPGWVVGTTTQSSSVGDRTLAFTYTVNDATASQSLTVTARQFAYATSTSPANSCALGYGTAYVFTYTPYTHPDGTAVQAGIGLTNTAVTESFNPQPPAPAQTGNSILNANSQFTDTISYCSTAPLTISATITQTISIEGYQVRQNSLTYSSAGVSVTNQGPIQ